MIRAIESLDRLPVDLRPAFRTRSEILNRATGGNRWRRRLQAMGRRIGTDGSIHTAVEGHLFELKTLSYLSSVVGARELANERNGIQ